MANYGPPRGGSPDPWHARRPDDAYDPRSGGGWDGYQPAHPYRQNEPGYDEPYQESTGGWPERDDGYRPVEPPRGHHADRRGERAYSSYQDVDETYAGTPVPRRQRRGPVVVVLAAVLLFVLGGGALMLYLLNQGEQDRTPVSAPGAPTPDGGLTGGTAPQPSAPAPESSADPRFVKAGECVRNEGSAGGRPKLLISECVPASYEVLRRFDGETSGEKDAEAKCAQVPGYTNWYFFDSELDTLDFVLCLKQR